MSVEVAEGELVAFLGHNWAGKSTSVRMLTTLLPPSSGSATVARSDIAPEPAGLRRKFGYVGRPYSLAGYCHLKSHLAPLVVAITLIVGLNVGAAAIASI
ncbi:ATP-binding cassette domain-containing protein [Pelagibacterium sp. H642]|uniref:ATP-binding cassette domain-containing protein n=1 Tax=Pelagibacterium sp. H642 TaxID=1881069 RepID=UPI0028152E9F|nr:ATP-binding cassette domain-containing protein [Pelagibacterium sp. H642]